jgi:DNA-binding NarL/FixJ family response regulator
MATRVLIADDHLVVRQGLRTLLEREGFNVVGEADNGLVAARLAGELRPEVVVLDFAMPLLNGIETAKKIRQEFPKTKVILLTMYKEDQYILEALKAGASGYVLKAQAMTDLVQAIHEVRSGAIYLSPLISRTVVDAYLGKTELPSDPLSSRERQVLQLVAEGHSTKEIANVLGISVKTAESHRGRVMEKLNIHETANLARYAIRRGLVQP